MKDKTPIWSLLLLFLIIFGIKAGLSFYMSGTFMYSDEACVIAKARDFAETFRIHTCVEITKAPAGTPRPFYPTLLSPIYLFFNGMAAYYGILIMNALIVSSSVFPLFGFLKRFIKSKKMIFVLIFATLFLPHIVLYEKMVATESSFIAANFWFLYFYLESFYQNKKRNKIIATLIAILGSFIRPFGFIMLIAMTVNEAILSKNKKKALTILVPLTILFIVISFLFSNGLLGNLIKKITALFRDPANILKGLEAVVNQFNSFIIATFFAPVVIFASYITEKRPDTVRNIRFFVLTFVILNFIVAANHIYGYLLQNDPLDLLTRYINSSLVYISFFTLIFLTIYKDYKLSRKNIGIIVVSLLALLLLKYDNAKHALNIVLSNFYDTSSFDANNNAAPTAFLAYYFLPVCFVLFAMIIFNKNKLLRNTLIVIFLIQGATIFAWISNFSAQQQENDIYQHFKHEEANILFLNSFKQRRVHYDYWRLFALSSNNMTVKYLDDSRHRSKRPNPHTEEAKEFLKDFDYIITRMPLNLEELKQFESADFVYIVPHEEE